MNFAKLGLNRFEFINKYVHTCKNDSREVLIVNRNKLLGCEALYCILLLYKLTERNLYYILYYILHYITLH